MIKISLPTGEDYPLPKHSPVIGPYIFPFCFQCVCDEHFRAEIFCLGCIFVWFAEEAISEISDARCPDCVLQTWYQDTPTGRIWAGLRCWAEGFEGGECRDRWILRKETSPGSSELPTSKCSEGLAFHPLGGNRTKQKPPKEDVEFYCLRRHLQHRRFWTAPFLLRVARPWVLVYQQEGDSVLHLAEE